MANSLETRNLCKSFGSLAVLDNWNLSIASPERLVLLGPSGAGKTTFLRIAAGLENPSRGEIVVRSKRLAFVFQEPRLIPWRSVRDNLLFVNPEADISGILEQLHLDGFEHYLPSQLSGGMQQRVNLARALIIEPELLILDEAFTSLDLPFKLSLIKDLLSQWREKRFTLITVTHDLKEALYLGDRILILSAPPARILHDFRVELPEERTFSDPDLLRLESRLLDMISQ